MGGSKSVFPSTPATTKPTKSPTPATAGAFSAFSGSGTTAFIAASSSTKSFGELLKTGDKSIPPGDKPKGAFAAPALEAEKPKNVPVKTEKPVESKPTLTQAPPATQASEPPTPSATPTKPSVSPPPIEPKPATPESIKGNGDDAQSSPDDRPDNSDTASEVGESDGEEIGDDDNRSFLSENFSSEEESEEEESEEDDEAQSPSRSISPQPEDIPLPPSRSSSTTPQNSATSSPPTSESSSMPLPTIKEEESTTPPGSPDKIPTGKSSAPSQGSSIPTPTSLAFTLGLGRPSTKPTRSSPLANAPVSSTQGEMEPKGKAPSPQPTKPLVSPKPVFGVLPLKKEADEDVKESEVKASRPMTPPLLSTLPVSKLPVPTPSTPILQPAAIPPPRAATTTPTVTPPSFFTKPPAPSIISPPASAPPGMAPFSLGKAPALPPGGLFGTSSVPTALPQAKPEPTKAFAPPSSFGGGGGGGLFGAPPPRMTPGTPMFSMKPPTPTMPATPTTQTSFFSSANAFAPKPGGPLFGAAPTTPAQAAFLKPSQPQPQPQPQPEVTMEEGMQKECAALVTNLAQELEEVSSGIRYKQALVAMTDGPLLASRLSTRGQQSSNDVGPISRGLPTQNGPGRLVEMGIGGYESIRECNETV